MKAVVVSKEETGQRVALTDFDEGELMEGDVTVRVSHSTINYKDGLAITGNAPVVRRWPMIPGIDFAGVVESSNHSSYKPGDAVLLNGWGTGETHLGAFAQKSRVKGDWLIRLPLALSPEQAMAIGTAGYTAMLCVMALEKHGLTPANGHALVTGAAGGVGSIAVALLSDLGWHVVASTGRTAEIGYLRDLGAADIIDRTDLAAPARALGKERFAATIDTVGSTTLASAIAQTRYGGAVAACGLAGGMDLPTSVAPFILRGVALYGIDSVMAPKPLRIAAWNRLAHELNLAKLERMTSIIKLGDVIHTGRAILEGQVRGRVVVKID